MSLSEIELTGGNRLTRQIRVKFRDCSEWTWIDYEDYLAYQKHTAAVAVVSTTNQNVGHVHENTDTNAPQSSDVDRATTTSPAVHVTTVRKNDCFNRNKSGVFRCEHAGCVYSTTNRGHMRDHTVIHTDEKPFACPEGGCMRKFGQKQTMERHRRLIHSENNKKRRNSADKDINSKQVSGMFRCDHPGCTYSTRRRNRFRMHWRAHTGEKPFACTVDGCTMAFLQKHDLKQHSARIHSGIAKSSSTGSPRVRAFCTARKLSQIKEGIEPYKCTETTCTYSTRYRSKMARHSQAHSTCRDTSQSARRNSVQQQMKMWEIIRRQAAEKLAKSSQGTQPIEALSADKEVEPGHVLLDEPLYDPRDPQPLKLGTSSSTESDRLYEVERIIGCVKDARRLWYLVKWKGFDETEDSWEESSRLFDAKDAIAEFVKKFGKVTVTNPKILSPEGQSL